MDEPDPNSSGEEDDDDADLPTEVEELTQLQEKPRLAEILRQRLDFPLFWLAVLAVPTGVIAAYGSSGFRYVFGILNTWLHVERGLSDGRFQLIGLAVGGLIFGIVLSVFKWKRFQGPAHVIVAAHEKDGRLGWKEGSVTAVADALALGIGASVGRYGPAVQFGATIGSQLGQLFRLSPTSLRILLGCGVAAAISASFNAPIAGAIFAHEVIIGHFRLRAFAPITLASVAAVAVTRFHGFEYIALKLWHTPDALTLAQYPAFLALGVMAAGIAILYMRGITDLGLVADKARIPLFLQPAIGGAIAGAVGLWMPAVLGLGDNVVQRALEQDAENLSYTIAIFGGLLVAKLLASVACLGLRYPGGAFMPAIFCGAMLGGVVGLLFPALEYQICVLVGMGAFVSSVIGAPIATILIVFELTESYEAATAVMVGVVASNALVTRFFARSLFHRQIRGWGVDLSRPPEQRILEKQVVSEVMRSGFLAVRPERTVSELRKLLDRGFTGDVFVTESDRRLLGYLPLAALATVEDPNLTARDLCREQDFVLFQDDKIWAAFLGLENYVGHSVPVLEDRESRRLVGVVVESDFITIYRDAIEKTRISGA